MQTNNKKVKSVIRTLVSLAESKFKDRCLAVYVMGSLARGGFSEVASDIDIGIILIGPLLPQDGEMIDAIRIQTIENSPKISNSISIFWGSIDSINGVEISGRYPPFDRLDLIDHALLLSGQNIRDQLIRPTKKELELASAEFAIDYLGNVERIQEFHSCERIVSKGIVYVTKTILFPTRFIYLQKTGQIAGNDTSHQYYIDHFTGSDSELVKIAYKWRQESIPTENEVERLLKNGLIPLYCRFIDIYSEMLKLYGETELLEKFRSWQENIINKQ